MKLRNFTMAIAAGLLAVAGAKQADAHATSIGYANGGPGLVNVWLGTYNHGTSSHHLEGSMNLVGVNGNPFASTTVAFSLTAGLYSGPTTNGASKPAGLIDGVTNFYAPSGCNTTNLPLVSTPNTCGGGVDHWQGATFAGLTAGDYQFTWVPINNPTQEWSVLNSNMNGVFTIDGTIITPTIPLPAAAPMLLAGLGLFGAMRARRKKAA